MAGSRPAAAQQRSSRGGSIQASAVFNMFMFGKTLAADRRRRPMASNNIMLTLVELLALEAATPLPNAAGERAGQLAAADGARPM